MDPSYFTRREDRIWWTNFFRKQLDLLGQRCAVWITEHMEDGHVYNVHPHEWDDNGHDVRCSFLIDTDRYGKTGVNFIYRLTGFVNFDNRESSWTVTTGVHIDGKDQQKFRVETDDPFAYFDPEVLFSWATQDNAGMNEGGDKGSVDTEQTLGDASVQELLDTLRQKLGQWDRFDASRRGLRD